MKKILFSLGVSLLALTSQAQNPTSRSFLDPNIVSFIVTNGPAGGASGLGGFTNLMSPINLTTNINAAGGSPSTSWTGVGTNVYFLQWTNTFGTLVIVTNNALSAAYQQSGYQYVTNNQQMMVADVPLWADRNGQIISQVVSNDAATYLSGMSLQCTTYGQSAANNGNVNLIFVGLPDGVHEAFTNSPTFQWGYSPAIGLGSSMTNFPIWKFAGCKAIRLRSATLTAATAANQGVWITSLTLNGFAP